MNLKECRKVFQDYFGKGNYRLIFSHCDYVLYVKKEGRFVFEAYNYKEYAEQLKKIKD